VRERRRGHPLRRRVRPGGSGRGGKAGAVPRHVPAAHVVDAAPPGRQVAGARLRVAKRSSMASESTTQAHWPLLDERAPFAAAPVRSTRRRLPRSAWLLTALAFLCGGLVSAAAFSIGWRHQAQRDTAARAALAKATDHVNRLSASLAAARETIVRERQTAA